MLIGIDTLFNEQWVLEFGLEENIKGKALTTVAINDSLFMGVGRHRYSDTKDAWAMIYNEQGEEVSYQFITTDKLGSAITESTFFEVEKINDSVFVATSGYFYGENDDVALGEIVFDTAGNVYNYSLRENTAGGNTSIVKTFDNKYAIACSYKYPNLDYDVYFYKVNDSLAQDTIYPGNYYYDSLCPNLPIQSGTIDLTGCSVITHMEEIPTLEEYLNQRSKIGIKVYPNPSETGTVTLSLTNTKSFNSLELRCFDVFGNEIHTENVIPDQEQAIIDVSWWAKGIYLLVIYAKGVPVGNAKVVVK